MIPPGKITIRSNYVHAFTLIELLVVIAIIAILAAIVMPVMGSMREKANSAQSITQMRQLGVGLATVAGDNNNNLPLGYGNDPVLRESRPKPSSEGYNFQMRLSDTPNMFGTTISPTTWVLLFRNKTAEVRGEGPDIKQKYAYPIVPYVGSTCYGINIIFTNDVALYGDVDAGTFTTLKLPHPSGTVIMTDVWLNPSYAGTNGTTADATFDYTKEINTWGSITYRHPGNRTALLFGDMHIQTMTKIEIEADKGVMFDPKKQL